MNSASIVTIVPFYNRRHTILAALASVKSQTVRPQRLVVIDDGSTDGGTELVIEWMAQVRGQLDCHLARQPNLGVAAARNHGLALAGHGEYVAFLDSDDIWPADFLERTQRALSAQRDAVAATCDRRFVFADGSPSRFDDSSPLAERPRLWMLERGAGIASATLFRRRAIDRRGGFNPSLRTGEDTALFLPLSLDGPWLHAPGEPITFHRGLAQRLGDEGNLSDKFRDNNRAWGQVYEDFFVGAGQECLSTPDCRLLLARIWYRAGRELLRNGAPREALACFRKSRAWNPWRAKCCAWMSYAWMARLTVALLPPKRPASHMPPAGNQVALARLGGRQAVA